MPGANAKAEQHAFQRNIDYPPMLTRPLVLWPTAGRDLWRAVVVQAGDGAIGGWFWACSGIEGNKLDR